MKEFDIEEVIEDGLPFNQRLKEHGECKSKFNTKWEWHPTLENTKYSINICDTCGIVIPVEYIYRKYSVQLYAGGVESIVQNRDVLRKYNHGDMVKTEIHHNYAPGKNRKYKKARLMIVRL